MSKTERVSPGGDHEQNSITRMGEELLMGGRRTAERYYLPEALGITEGDDYTLFSHYLAQRIMRNSIYNTSLFLSRPTSIILASSRIFGKYISGKESSNRLKKEILKHVESRTQAFVDNNYSSPEARQRARDIELAVNDLAARSTVDRRNRADIVLSKKVIEVWGNDWKERLSQQPPAEE